VTESHLDDAQLTELCSGLGFVEGPLWTSDGRLLVTSISRGEVYEVALAGGAEPLLEVGGTPTGLAEDRSGHLWVMQPGPSPLKSSSEKVVDHPCLQRWSVRDRTQVSEAASGIVAPNDCILGPDGRIWFGDMIYTDERRETDPARVSAMDPETGAVEVMSAEVVYPNGIGFDPAGTTMYACSTGQHEVLAFDWDGTSLANRRVLAALGEDFHADGLALDQEGNLYVAAAWGDAVYVLAPSGDLIQKLDLPGTRVVSVCFAGPKLDTLVMTAAKGGRVLALPAPIPGLPAFTA
jgi:gluconolactonase